MAQQFPNSFAQGAFDTLLAADITSGASSLTVQTLPAGVADLTHPREFSILVRTPGGGSEEWIHISDTDGGGDLVWTVASRGYAASTPAAHATNDEIYLVVLGDDLIKLLVGRTHVPDQLQVNGDWGLTAPLTPAAITADTDDYEPTGLDTASHMRLSTDASRNLTGIAAPGYDGRRLTLLNVGANDIVLKDRTTSASGNQFALGADLALSQYQGVELIYDQTLGYWLRIG